MYWQAIRYGGDILVLSELQCSMALQLTMPDPSVLPCSCTTSPSERVASGILARAGDGKELQVGGGPLYEV